MQLVVTAGVRTRASERTCRVEVSALRSARVAASREQPIKCCWLLGTVVSLLAVRVAVPCDGVSRSTRFASICVLVVARSKALPKLLLDQHQNSKLYDGADVALLERVERDRR